MEEWRKIRDFPGYEVSSSGKVKSYINNRHGIGQESHILKPVINQHGYETVCLGRNNRRLVHRLTAEAFIPNPNNYPLVRHLDDDPKNNNVSNLAWGTQTDNMQDCVKHGRLVGDTSAAIQSRKRKVYAWPKSGNKHHKILYDSVTEASRDLNVWPQHIISVIQGKITQTGGYVFEYLDKEENYGTY